MSVPDLNLLALYIFTLVDIEAFVSLLDVTEVLSLVGEDLPPSRVGAPNLHVVGSS